MNNIVRVYTTLGEIDGIDDISINQTFAFTDITDPTKRAGNGTYQVRAEITKNNKILFSNIEQLAIESSFNPNLKIDAWITVGTITTINGYLQLTNIIIEPGTDSGYYEFVVTDVVSDFIEIQGKKKLNQLTSLNQFNHILTYDNVVNSRNVSIQSFSQSVGFNKGYGYVYGQVDYGGRSKQRSFIWNLEGFRPHPYLHTIWNAMFNEAGFTWEDPSGFVGGDYWRSLVLTPVSTGGQLTTDEVNSMMFSAGPIVEQSFVHNDIMEYDISGSIYIGGTFPYQAVRFQNDSVFQYAINYFDNSGVYNTASNFFIPQVRSIQNLSATVYVRMEFSSANPFDFRGTSVMPIQEDVSAKTTLRIIRTRGVIQTVMGDFEHSWGSFAKPTAVTYSVFTQAIPIDIPNVDVYPNDKYHVEIFSGLTSLWYFPYPVVKWQQTIEVAGTEFHNSIVNDRILEGNKVVLPNYLPDWSCEDFFATIRKKYNLVVQYDKDRDKHLIITPFQNFFDFGQAIDWTEIDKRSQVEKRPIPLIQTKEVLLTDKLNSNVGISDGYNKQYGEVYGQKTYTINNNFVSGVTDIDLLTGDSILQYDGNSDRIVTNFFNWGENSLKNEVDYTPALLFYNFLASPDDYYIASLGGTTSYFDGSVTYSNLTLQTNYAYVGHLDNPYDPAYDNNFFEPKQFYVDVPYLSTANVYNQFWKNRLDEMYDQNASMVTGFFNLTINDIFECIHFNRPIFLWNTYYYINQIIDYNPAVSSLTKVELVKFNDIGKIRNYKKIKAPFVIGTTASTGALIRKPPVVQIDPVGPNQVGGRVKLDNLIRGNGSIINSENSIILGHQSVLTSTVESASVLGSRAQINNSKNISIIGDNNYMEGVKSGLILGNNVTASFGGKGPTSSLPTNLKNVLIVGDNISASQSNTIYTTNLVITGSVSGIPSGSIGPTGPTGTQSLSQTLAIGATSGIYNISTGVGRFINSVNGGAYLALDSGTVSNRIVLSNVPNILGPGNTASYLYLYPTVGAIVATDNVSLQTNKAFISVGGPGLGEGNIVISTGSTYSMVLQVNNATKVTLGTQSVILNGGLSTTDPGVPGQLYRTVAGIVMISL